MRAERRSRQLLKGRRIRQLVAGFVTSARPETRGPDRLAMGEGERREQRPLLVTDERWRCVDALENLRRPLLPSLLAGAAVRSPCGAPDVPIIPRRARGDQATRRPRGLATRRGCGQLDLGLLPNPQELFHGARELVSWM